MMKLRILLIFLTVFVTCEGQEPSIIASSSSVQSQPTPVLLLSGRNLDPINRFIDISFDPDVYHSSGGGLQASDLELVFKQSSGTATNCTISSITKTSGAALTGGENTVRVNLTITGTSAGIEVIWFRPSAAGSYKDSGGRPVSLVDSTEPIVLNLGYNSTYSTALGYAVDNAITLPSLPQRLIDNTLINTLDTEGVLTETDLLYLVAGDAGREFAKINIKSPGNYTASENNSPTYTTNSGFKGNSSDMSLNLGWDSKTNGVKYIAGDASAIYYSSENIAQNSVIDFGARGDLSLANTTGGRLVINPRNAANSLSYRINTTTTGVLSQASSTNSKGVFHLSRNGTDVKVYKDGSVFASTTDGTGTLSTYDMHWLCENVAGTLASFTSRTIGFWMCGSNLDSKASVISNAINTWALTKEATPSNTGRFYALLGQSNIDGRGSYSELPGYLQSAIANCYFWTGSGWAALHAGVAGGGSTTIGPIFSLAYAETLKHPGENLYFIKQAVGGTDMATDWQQGGAQYNAFMTQYTAASATLTITSYEAIYEGQGEADCRDLTKANNYETNEQSFALDILSDTNFDRLIVMQIHNSLPPVQYPYDATVQTAKSNNFANGKYGATGDLITTSDLSLKADLIHFDTAGVITLGERFSTATD